MYFTLQSDSKKSQLWKKSPGGHVIYRRNEQGARDAKFHLSYHILLPPTGWLLTPSPSPSVCTYVRVYADVINKFSRINWLPNFLSNGAPRARTATLLLEWKGCYRKVGTVPRRGKHYHFWSCNWVVPFPKITSSVPKNWGAVPNFFCFFGASKWGLATK